MSTSIDNRVVKLGFDNKAFEEGVSKSMSTLERLEEKLQFKKSIKGISALQVGIDGVNFEELAKKIDKIEGRLTGFGIAGAEVIKDITNTIINGVKKIGDATIGQISRGGWSRAMNLENAKFSIEGLGLDWQEMLKAINYGVQDTAYGLDAAASAAAQLAASGIQYQESIDGANDSLMHKTLRAISGVAAMTNSSYEEISRIFASAAGQGAVMGDTLAQLGARSMNAAAIIGKALNMSESDVREMASARMLDFETFAVIMDESFGEHAKEANKTFNGALSNMQAALNRFGAVFSTPVVQNTNRFFIALTDRIKELKNMISDVTEGGKVLYEGLESHFAQMWSALIDMSDVLIHAANLDWFRTIADSADAAATKLTTLFTAVVDVWSGAEEENKKLKDYSKITEAELEIVQKVLNGTFGNGAKRIKNVTAAIADMNKKIEEDNQARALADLSTRMDKITATADDIQQYVNIIAQFGYNFKKTGIELVKFKDSAEELEDVIDPYEVLLDLIRDIHTSAELTGKAFMNIWDMVTDVVSVFVQGLGSDMMLNNIVDSIKQGALYFLDFTKELKKATPILEYVYEMGSKVGSELTYMIAEISEIWSFLWREVKFAWRDWMDYGQVDGLMTNIYFTVSNVTETFTNLVLIVRQLAKAFIIAFLRVWDPATATNKFKSLSGAVRALTGALIPSEQTMYAIADALTAIFSAIKAAKQMIRGVVSTIMNTVTAFAGIGEQAEEGEEKVSVLGLAIGGILGIITKLFEILSAIPPTIEAIFERLQDDERIQHLITSILGLKDALGEEGLFDGFLAWLDGIKDSVESVDVVDLIADGIGAMAEGLATFVDKLPGYLSDIKSFFNDLKDVWLTFKDAVLGKDHPETIGNAQTIAEQIGQDLRNFYTSIDWKGVLAGGLESASILVLLQLTHLIEIAKSMFFAMSSLGFTAVRIAWKFGSILNAAKNLINAFALSSMMATAAISLVAIVSAISVVATLDEHQIENAIVVLEIALAAFAVVAYFFISYQKWKFNKYGITSVQVRLIGALNSIIDVIGTFAMLIGIGIMVSKILDSFTLLITQLNKMGALIDTGLMGMTLAVIGTVIAFFGAIVSIMTISLKGRHNRWGLGAFNINAGMIADYVAIAAMIIAITASVWLIIQAIGDLQKTLSDGVNTDTWFVLAGILITVITVPLLIFGLLTKMPMQATSASIILSLAGIIAVMCLGLIGIIGALTLLIPAINLIYLSGSQDLFIKVMGMIALMVGILLIGMAAIIWAFSRQGASIALSGKTVKAIAVTMLMIALILAVIALSLGGITLNILSLTAAQVDPAVLRGILGDMLIIITVILGGLIGLIFVIGRSGSGAWFKQAMNSVALVLGVVAVSMIAMAYAISILTDALSKNKVSAGSILLVFGLFIAVVAAIIIASLLLATKLKTTGAAGDFKDTLEAIALGMIGIAAALLVFAAAVWVLGQAPADALEKMGWVCLGFAVALGVLIAVAALIPGVKTAMIAVGMLFTLLGAGALLAGLGALALGVGLALLTPLLIPFSIGLKALFTVLEGHVGLFLIISGIFILIMALAVAFAGKIAPILTAIVNTIGKAIEVIGELLKKAGSGLVNWLKGMGPAAKVAVGILIAAIISALSGQGPEILKTLGKIIMDVLDWLSGAIGPLASKLVDLLLDLLEAIVDAIAENGGVIFQLAVKAIATVVGLIFQALQRIGNLVAKPVFKILGLEIPEEDLHWGDWIANKLNELANQGMAESKRLREEQREATKQMKEYAESAGNVADKTRDATAAGKELEDQSNRLVTAMDRMTDRAQGYATSVQMAMYNAGAGAFGKEGKFFSHLAENMTPQAIDDAISKNLGAWGKDGKFFTIATSKIEEATAESTEKSVIGGIKNGISNGFMAMLQGGSFDAATIFDKFGGGQFKGLDISQYVNENGGINLESLDVNGLSLDFSSVMGENGAIDMSAFGDVMGMDMGESLGLDFSSGYAEGINDEDSKQAIVDATNETVDLELETRKERLPDYYLLGNATTEQYAKGTKDKRNDMVAAGEWIIEGFQQPFDSFLGINTNGNQVYGPANPKPRTARWYSNEIVSQLIDPITYALEIDSPSKVMKRLGGYVIAGLQIGLDSGIGTIGDSSKSLSDTIISSFGDPLRYAAMVDSGDLVYDPSIRPVWDSSNLASGITSINAMLADQNVTVSGFSGRLAADISGLDATNNGIVEELRALRSDMNVMTQEITNMQVVMDTGRLVGSMSGPMNRALGQEQMYRGRGM